MNIKPSRTLTQPTEVRLYNEHDLTALRDLAGPSQLTTVHLSACPQLNRCPV